MAYIDPFSQVNRGMEGTGAAAIFTGNRAADAFNQQLNIQQQQRRMAEMQRIKALQEQQQASEKFLQDVKVGNHWANDNEFILGEYEKNMKYAAELKAQGKDPSRDQTFLANVQKNQAHAAYSKASEAEFNKFLAEYEKDPNKIENADEIIAWKSQPLDVRMRNGVLPPKPIIKFTLSDAVKDSNGAVAYTKNNDGTYDTTKINRAGIVDQAIGSLDLDAAKYLIKKNGGDSSVFTKGFPIVTEDGKRLWNTQGKEFESSVANVLDETPEFVDYLKTKGYDTSNPKTTFDSALDFAAKQNKAVGRYITEYTDTIAGKGTTDKSRVYSAEANARAKRAEGRAIANDNKPDQVSTYRQSWINDMFDGVSGSGEKLVAAAKGNPIYNGNLKIGKIKGSHTKLLITIPDKVIESTDEYGTTKKVIKGRTVTLDKNNADDKITLNEIVSEITGEKVNVSQLMTDGGKKKVAGANGAQKINEPSADPLNIF